MFRLSQGLQPVGNEINTIKQEGEGERVKLLASLNVTISNDKNKIKFQIDSNPIIEEVLGDTFTSTGQTVEVFFHSEKEVTRDAVLAKFLLVFRQYLGLTQGEIAKYLFLTAQQYQKYEGNKHPVTNKKLQELFTGVCITGNFTMNLIFAVEDQMTVRW